MSFVIEDGQGNGKKLGIDSRFRAKVAALTETESNNATLLGLKYNINTGDITITNSAKLTVLYLKNNDDRNLIIDTLIYNIGTSTNGTSDVLIDVLRNPSSTGAIITNANPPHIGISESANLNFGSSTTLETDVFIGTQGETVLAGTEVILTRRPNPSGAILISPGGGLLLTKGSSLAINYTPPAGNTSQVAQFAMNVYVRAER